MNSILKCRLILKYPWLVFSISTWFACGCKGNSAEPENDGGARADDTNSVATEEEDSSIDSAPPDAQVITECLAGQHYITDEASYLEYLPYECIAGLLRISMGTAEELRFPYLKRVQGNLAIGDNPLITKVPRFDVLEEVDGTLFITENPRLTDLGGLSNLKRITEGMTVSENDSLVTLAGLEGLESFRGTLEIEANPMLERLGIFQNTDVSFNYLNVIENPVLANLEELSGLTSTSSSIRIFRNASLTSLTGLEQVREVGIQVVLLNNESLSDISALFDLEHIQTSLEIEGNALTTIEGFDALTHVTTIQISEDAVERISGFSSLTSISSDLIVTGCATLQSISGFGSLTEIEDNVEIYDNPMLVSTDALARVTTVGGGLYIGTSQYRYTQDWEASGNAVLETLSLDALTAVGGVHFIAVENPRLPTCELCEILSRLDTVPGTIDLQGNLADTCGAVIADSTECK